MHVGLFDFYPLFHYLMTRILHGEREGARLSRAIRLAPKGDNRANGLGKARLYRSKPPILPPVPRSSSFRSVHSKAPQDSRKMARSSTFPAHIPSVLEAEMLTVRFFGDFLL